MHKKTPKLRSVEKYHPKYPLNKFPEDFDLKLGKEIVQELSPQAVRQLFCIIRGLVRSLLRQLPRTKLCAMWKLPMFSLC